MIPVFPTAYFGNLSYYSALLLHSTTQIEAKEHFIKQTYRNRCEILTPSGVQALSIPVIRKNGSKTVIDQVEISYDTDWRKDHWKAIKSAYASSPYFDHYENEVKELIYQDESNLLKFNQTIFNRISSWLQLPIITTSTSEFQVVPATADFRSCFKDRNMDVQHSQKYIQVFGEQNDFTPNLSVLDAVFCLGPMARLMLTGCQPSIHPDEKSGHSV